MGDTTDTEEANDRSLTLSLTETDSTTSRETQKLLRKLEAFPDVHVSGGPFHFQMRAGTYGEVYDEPAWKFMYGIAEAKERSGCEDNPMKQRYCDKRVLLNNWLEEQRDREFIKYDNSPKLSQYGHMYRTEYSRAYTKPLCNKVRDILLKIPTFPLTAHPAHQPDIEVNTIRCSAPKPQSCIDYEETVKCRKKKESEERYAKHARELSGGS